MGRLIDRVANRFVGTCIARRDIVNPSIANEVNPPKQQYWQSIAIDHRGDDVLQLFGTPFRFTRGGMQHGLHRRISIRKKLRVNTSNTKETKGNGERKKKVLQLHIWFVQLEKSKSPITDGSIIVD